LAGSSAIGSATIRTEARILHHTRAHSRDNNGKLTLDCGSQRCGHERASFIRSLVLQANELQLTPVAWPL